MLKVYHSDNLASGVKKTATLFFVAVFSLSTVLFGQVEDEHVKITSRLQHEAVSGGGESAIEVRFEPAGDWYFYATGDVEEMILKVTASADVVKFGKVVFPAGQEYFDKVSKTNLEIFKGGFSVYVPFAVKADAEQGIAEVEIAIVGAMCSGQMCVMKDYVLTAEVKVAADTVMGEAKFELPKPVSAAGNGNKFNDDWVNLSVGAALVFAFLAGLILNIMPCVLPVIPLKVISIFEQAKESKRRCELLGLAFCGGIVLFFASLAVINIVLRIGYGTVFQWGDHFRSAGFIVAMSLLMVVLALFMFGLFQVTVSGAIANRTGKGKGYFGSVGMGFLAALLSTPCSFAILTAAFAWAQTQALPLATLTIILIGVGMAAPYAVLTSMPELLKYLPKAGRWTELFKQAMGFVLLVVAVWLASVLPAARRIGFMYYAVIAAFCVWMWGVWVTFNTPLLKKWIIRIAAVCLAVTAGFWLLPESKAEGIEWLEYDAAAIEANIDEDRPVLVEFMAQWCLTCKAVEKTVYSRDDIEELIHDKGVLTFQGDTTLAGSKATVDLKNVYNEPGVPVSLLFVPGRDEPVRFHGLVFGDKLKEALESLADKK